MCCVWWASRESDDRATQFSARSRSGSTKIQPRNLDDRCPETRFRVSTHGSEAQPGKAEFVGPEQFDFAPGRLHESNGLGVSIDRDAPSRRNREYVQAETGGRFVLVGENAVESLERSNRMGLV